MTLPTGSDAVWLLWELDYDVDQHDYVRMLVGVYGSQVGAEAAQVSRGIADFEIDRQEIR